MSKQQFIRFNNKFMPRLSSKSIFRKTLASFSSHHLTTSFFRLLKVNVPIVPQMDLELVVPNAWSVIHHVCSVTETPQRIALSAILERITIAKIIVAELVTWMAITFRDRIVINVTQVV